MRIAPPTSRARHAGPTAHRSRGWRAVVVLPILLLALAACSPDTENAALPRNIDYPAWLLSVSPIPGAEAAPTDIIEVQHTLIGEFEGVRILIDGIDVTADALPNEGTQGVGGPVMENDQNPVGRDDENTAEGEGLLAYDPNTEVAPVQIQPGEHTVVLQKVRQPIPEESDLVVEDTFEWTFTVR